MADESQRERELRLRRENELKDLEVERTIGPRPLEGLTGSWPTDSGGTTWTAETDEAAAREVHGDDERRSRKLSESQVPELPREDEPPRD